jgi:two-component system response regulator LytT
MKVLIIEDEVAAARRLQKMISGIIRGAQIIDVLDSIESSVIWFKKHDQPELVFMDIHLADGDCFEIFKQVSVECPVIFTTAYDEYAIRAFEVNAIAYLMKPIKDDELQAAMVKFEKLKADYSALGYQKLTEAMNLNSSGYQKRLLLKLGQTIRAIEIADISYFFTQDKIVSIVTAENRKYPSDYTLDQLEKILDPKMFFRINRQIIVNSKAIREMYVISKSRVKLNLHPPTELETAVSAERVAHFKKWLTEESK